MDFRLNEEQSALQAAARKYARERLAPLAAATERSDTPPSHELLHEYAQMGFLGINVASAYGGLGLGNIEALVVLEEFGKVSAALAFPVFESSVGPVRAIERFAPEELRARVVPRVCAGELVVAVSMSEPQAGSALTDLTTRAEVRGEQVVISGTKRWCSGGGHAGGYVVYCRMSEAKGAAGIGAVYVEAATKGLTYGA
ncbi:MAG TPA: acyl-CoA dehydrogenase family protein, partial [Steroidobacteraceae bacterium]